MFQYNEIQLKILYLTYIKICYVKFEKIGLNKKKKEE